MPRVRFTSNLSRLFPNLDTIHVNVTDVADLVREADAIFPRLASYLVDERGALRRHVNIFVGDNPVRDRVTLNDAVSDGDEIYIVQALSGG